jgi:hypothetical protein
MEYYHINGKKLCNQFNPINQFSTINPKIHFKTINHKFKLYKLKCKNIK